MGIGEFPLATCMSWFSPWIVGAFLSYVKSIVLILIGIWISFVDCGDAADVEAFRFDFSQAVPLGGRANPYSLPPIAFANAQRQGLRHALADPETNHGLAMPYQTLDNALRMAESAPWARSLLLLSDGNKFGTSWDELYKRLGLFSYPEHEASGAYFIPFPVGGRPSLPIGVAIGRNALGAEVYTQSCASCHCRNLFGTPVLGAANLQPRSQEFLNFGHSIAHIPAFIVEHAAGGKNEEFLTFRAAQRKLAFHAAKDPVALGLDTPHASVALSLMKRGTDPYALTHDEYRLAPRKTPLATWPSDVKIANWWTIRYKNKFFVDGSVSGNPVLTNFLWIKLVQGADLEELEDWVLENDEVIRDLTAAVFGAEPPRWSDFFPVHAGQVEMAKAGEQHYRALCARCHGTYSKAWSLPNADELSPADQFQTVGVQYFPDTRLKNVGTDGHRAAATKMISSEINRLHFTQRFGLYLEPGATDSYVPPPLDGIWARWPYLHNNSVPSLADLLSPEDQRPTAFYVVPAIDRTCDFDSDRVGFPTEDRVEQHWRSPERFFDTRIPGLSNKGHDKGIFIVNGVNVMNDRKRRELIAFLKSL